MSTVPKANPAQRFAAGFFSPFHAGQFLLQQPGLLRFILIPLTINILVFTGAVWGGLHFFNTTVIHHLPQGDAWYWALLTYLVWLLAILVTMVLVFFAFAVVGNLIASPFNDLLSERTEELISGNRSSEAFSFGGFFRDAGRTLVEESKKMLAFLVGMGLLLLLNLLPAVGTLLYAVLSVLWTLIFLVVEYTGYPAGRKRIGFASQRRYLARRKLVMLGFGCGLFCLLAIPFLQLLCIPLGVISATRLWCSDPPAELTAEEGE